MIFSTIKRGKGEMLLAVVCYCKVNWEKAICIPLDSKFSQGPQHTQDQRIIFLV